jgi:hypothetical protein
MQIPASAEELLPSQADPALIIIVILRTTQTKFAMPLILFDKMHFLLASSDPRIQLYSGEV